MRAMDERLTSGQQKQPCKRRTKNQRPPFSRENQRSHIHNTDSSQSVIIAIIARAQSGIAITRHEQCSIPCDMLEPRNEEETQRAVRTLPDWIQNGKMKLEADRLDSGSHTTSHYGMRLDLRLQRIPYRDFPPDDRFPLRFTFPHLFSSLPFPFRHDYFSFQPRVFGYKYGAKCALGSIDSDFLQQVV